MEPDTFFITMDVVEKEHEAWITMCKEIQKVFNITPEEFNKPTYRKMVEMIERWAYYDRKRREAFVAAEGEDKYPFGTFWKGE